MFFLFRYFFTLLFLALLQLEWPVYTDLRHEWLSLPSPHTHAVLILTLETALFCFFFRYFFTLLFLALLQLEWPVYTDLRHEWLSLPSPHTHAVLMRVEPADTSEKEIQRRLYVLFPGEVEAVLPLRRPTQATREYHLTGAWSERGAESQVRERVCV